MTFDYTKANRTTDTSRSFYPIVYPSTMYEGIDISELDAEDQAFFVNDMEVAKDKFLLECKVLQQKYDVATNYRRFDASKMTNIDSDTL